MNKAKPKSKSAKSKVEPVVVMVVKDKNILIRAINVNRFTQHGFGFFLEEIKAGEILATQAVLDAVNKGKSRNGLCPMEIFEGNIIGFCTQVVPVNELSVHYGATTWFNKCCIVDDEKATQEMNKK